MFELLHEKLKTSMQESASCTIICYGDSVTQGCFGPQDVHPTALDSYSVKLHSALQFLYPEKVINVLNAGVAGDTATRALLRFERDVLSHNPDLVIVAFGVNDFGNTDAYIESLGKIFDELNTRNIPCIYMTEHMMNTYSADDTSENIKEYSKVTAEAQNNGTLDNLWDRGIALAHEKGVAVCDVYHKWKKLHASGVDITKLLANRINHPVKQMHDLFVTSIIETLFFAE